MPTAADALAWERSQLGHVGGGKYWQEMGYNYTDANAPAWYQMLAHGKDGLAK